jgi:hyperosmotically inducible periplasmic protein
MVEKIALVVACAIAASVTLSHPVSAAAATDADNSKVNKEEQQQNQPAADQQGENEADRKITQEIRRAVVKNKTLSQYAHNVKIITQGGTVTLKGPVRTMQEKSIVGKAAAKVAGKGKVVNELEIAPAK